MYHARKSAQPESCLETQQKAWIPAGAGMTAPGLAGDFGRQHVEKNASSADFCFARLLQHGERSSARKKTGHSLRRYECACVSIVGAARERILFEIRLRCRASVRARRSDTGRRNGV